jgi:hypothetical protein
LQNLWLFFYMAGIVDLRFKKRKSERYILFLQSIFDCVQIKRIIIFFDSCNQSIFEILDSWILFMLKA